IRLNGIVALGQPVLFPYFFGVGDLMLLRGVRDFRSARILIVIAIISSVMARPRTLVLGGGEKVSLVTDWSHRHVVYSAPKSLVRAFHLSGDSRYVQQWVRRNAERKRHHHHDHEWFEEGL